MSRSLNHWRNSTRGRVDEVESRETHESPESFKARQQKSARANYERASREAPFCPDDPTEAMTARRDPVANFIGAKVRR